MEEALQYVGVRANPRFPRCAALYGIDAGVNIA
jgi:hypothetical protein